MHGEDSTGGWRKMLITEHQNLYSPNIVKFIKGGYNWLGM
jgi:hypothetical protein